MYLYLCDFDICDTLVLILYGDVIFSTRCPRKLMMWCSLILAHDVELEDDGFWHVYFVIEILLHIHKSSSFIHRSKCCDSLGYMFLTEDSS
jgi:hypothetical protein